MKATYKDLYKKFTPETKKVTTVFRYLLSGKEADLTRYRQITEDGGFAVHTDEATGKMLYFSTIDHGTTVEVVITETGKIVVPNRTLDGLQSQMLLATDPAIKQALASAIAQYMVDRIINGSTKTVSIAPVESTIEDEIDEEEEETPVKTIKPAKKSAKADPAVTNLDD